ncbi:hypothetical protein [Pyrinomonas sp.]|uniref:hypothetical protein n=1 Tax=Pyrinomonas sp. TaxID=2080306 RepID=UPI00332CD9EF
MQLPVKPQTTDLVASDLAARRATARNDELGLIRMKLTNTRRTTEEAKSEANRGGASGTASPLAVAQRARLTAYGARV